MNRVLAAALAAGWAVAGVVLPVLPAAVASSGVELQLTSTTTMVRTAQDNLEVKGLVTNNSTADIKGEVNLRLANHAFGDRAELEAWRDPDADLDIDKAAWACKAQPGMTIKPGESETFAVTCSSNNLKSELGDTEPGWGPWGLLVDFTSYKGPLAVKTGFVVYAPADAVKSKVQLAASVPLVQTGGESAADAAARLGDVARATDQSLISWVVDPAVMASERKAGSTGGLTALVKGAVNRGQPVYAVPYGNPDLSRLAHSGAPPQDLIKAARQIGQLELEASLGAEAAKLVDTQLAWSSGTIDAQTVDLVSKSGFAALVLGAEPSSNQRTPTATAVTYKAGAVTLPGIAADAALGQALQESSLGVDQGYLGAALAFDAAQAQVTGQTSAKVLALPNGWQPNPSAIQALNALGAAPWVERIAVGQIGQLTGERPKLTVAASSGPSTGPSDVWLGRVAETASRAWAFAGIADQSQAFTEQAMEGLLTAVGKPCGSRTECDLLADDAVTQAEGLMSQVSVVTGGDVNLLSGEGKVPIVVSNAMATPVHDLKVVLRPDTKAVRVGPAEALSVAAGGSSTARIPITAVANGRVRVAVELRNRTGQLVANPTYLNVRVRAEWEDVGTRTVGGLTVVVLIVGVVRAFRRRKRAR